MGRIAYNLAHGNTKIDWIARERSAFSADTKVEFRPLACVLAKTHGDGIPEKS